MVHLRDRWQPAVSVGKPMNSSQKLQAEGRESRQCALDAILELLTGDATSSEQMRESAMTLVYFEPKILAEIDRIGRSYDEPKTRELRVALLLEITLRAMELLAWGRRCLRTHRAADTLIGCSDWSAQNAEEGSDAQNLSARNVSSAPSQSGSALFAVPVTSETILGCAEFDC